MSEHTDLFKPFPGDYVLPVFEYMVPVLQNGGGLEGLLEQLHRPVVVTGGACRWVGPVPQHVYVLEDTVRLIREMVTISDAGGRAGGLTSAPGALWDYMRREHPYDPDIVTHVKVWAVIDAVHVPKLLATKEKRG